MADPAGFTGVQVNGITIPIPEAQLQGAPQALTVASSSEKRRIDTVLNGNVLSDEDKLRIIRGDTILTDAEKTLVRQNRVDDELQDKLDLIQRANLAMTGGRLEKTGTIFLRGGEKMQVRFLDGLLIDDLYVQAMKAEGYRLVRKEDKFPVITRRLKDYLIRTGVIPE